MDSIRLLVRKTINIDNWGDISAINEIVPPGSETVSLQTLWSDISSHSKDEDAASVNENLIVTRIVLENSCRDITWNQDEKNSARAIYHWLSQLSLPSPTFASALETAYVGSGEKISELPRSLHSQKISYALAISCIKWLDTILPILEVENSEDILVSVVSHTSLKDPWTTNTSLQDATTILQSSMGSERRLKCWSILERICQSKIKPIFAKTKTPAITASGRKNLHPLPRQRFDESLFDPQTKPWKHNDIYATTVLDWILGQYTDSEFDRLENQFHLFVPPILSLIDDESLSFKSRGCHLLMKFLTPLRTADSDLLKRTNLASVFDEALTPCLLSLPTITPEDEALNLLGAAYPALLLTLKTRYHIDSVTTTAQPSEKNSEKRIYTSRITTLLRDNVMSSFHHVSSHSPASANEDISSLASFPYPKLSTFLLNQLSILIRELGIQTTKYLQELLPVIYKTLTNSFGTAFVPLLRSGIATMHSVILTSYPRIWRYRGDLLSAICQCWSNVIGDESSTTDPERKSQLRKVMLKLQGAVWLLKVSVRAAGRMEIYAEDDSESIEMVDEKDVNIDNDILTLIGADGQLKELLEIDADGALDDVYFF